MKLKYGAGERMMGPEALVVGLGNTLRGDDGIGARVVERLDGLLSPSSRKKVDLKIKPQVDLVDAELIKNYNLVIFIDAAQSEDNFTLPVQLKKLEPALIPSFTSHIGSIPTILLICAKLFGTAPACYLVAIKGETYDFGQELSTFSAKKIDMAVKTVFELLGELPPLG